ncbi:MAG: hypothetical protein WBF08_11860 [Candidatus Bathyarchaeia archaeon]
MKKNLSFKLLSLITILTVILVFIGIDFVEGQVKTLGKPNKPPGKAKYVWSAVILDDPGLGLKGMIDDTDRYDETWPGWVFDDSESNVNVGVEIRRAPFDGVDKYWTRFFLEIFYPVQVDFNFMPYDAHFYPDSQDPLCKYPGGYDPSDPLSMLYFLQDANHPHPLYHKVLFRFNTDRSVNRDDVDYEQWNYHGHMSFLSDVSGPAPSGFSPVSCEDYELFEFSHIEFGGADSEDGDYGYFERIDGDIWKVVAGMEIDPIYDYTISADDDNIWATDWYNICVETQINKKKRGSTYDAIFSSQGSLDMKFAVLFVRTRQ